MKVKQHHIAESHRLQFAGQDYQRAAVGIATQIGLNPDNESDYAEYQELESAPDPGCECGFCKTAEWEE